VLRFEPLPLTSPAPSLAQWARKKKIAAGVDPDEDFAAGREAESKIYVVGGVSPCRRAARRPRTLLPAQPTLSRPASVGPLLSALSVGWCAALNCVRAASFSCQGSSRCSCLRSPASGPTTRATSLPSKPRPIDPSRPGGVAVAVRWRWRGRAHSRCAREGVWHGSDDKVAPLRQRQLWSLGLRVLSRPGGRVPCRVRRPPTAVRRGRRV
jgi:hypothetical protein